MANLEAIIAEKSQQDNQWRAEMQADRENTIAMQDAGVEEITSSPELYVLSLIHICSGGGLCVRERDVFLRGSHGHRVWISQRPEAGEEAYCVILKGRDRDSPTGDIRSFDFSAHLHRLEHTAVEAKAVELVFYSGRRFSMEPERYRAAMEDLFWEYGTLRRIRYLPENEAALVRTIMMEHRYQKGWMPKKDRAPPSGPVR